VLPHAIGFKKNPDGARLRDLLPADVYARWLLMKAKYIGADEGMVPIESGSRTEITIRRAITRGHLLLNKVCRGRGGSDNRDA